MDFFILFCPNTWFCDPYRGLQVNVWTLPFPWFSAWGWQVPTYPYHGCINIIIFVVLPIIRFWAGIPDLSPFCLYWGSHRARGIQVLSIHNQNIQRSVCTPASVVIYTVCDFKLVACQFNLTAVVILPYLSFSSSGSPSTGKYQMTSGRDVLSISVIPCGNNVAQNCTGK